VTPSPSGSQRQGLAASAAIQTSWQAAAIASKPSTITPKSKEN
jgi:hypothetical protein